MNQDIVRKLANGERISRHEFESREAVEEMIKMGWLDRDHEGLIIRGELFHIHFGHIDGFDDD